MGRRCPTPSLCVSYTLTVYQPMLELLKLLDDHGFSCWIFSGGGADFMRAWASEVYGLPLHRLIGSIGTTEFRLGDNGPELVKGTDLQILNDGPQKPISIHTHVGQRPILAAGNTDGDLPMLQWTAASPYRTLELAVHHTDGDREYATTPIRFSVAVPDSSCRLRPTTIGRWSTWLPTGPRSSLRPNSRPGWRSLGFTTRSSLGHHFRMLTARAMTSPRMTSDPAASRVMSNLAHRAKGMTSVGLKAVALVKPT
jgi:hypothetical protein